MNMEHERIDFDVVFVGGGPASLAGAIRLMQLAQKKHMSIEVALIEKVSEIGAHDLSGAVLNTIALKELLPDYLDRGCPIETSVRGDGLFYLTDRKAVRSPFVPRQMHNVGHSVISLSKFVRWLGSIAEEMGVNIFPGFAGKSVLLDEDGKTVIGVRTGDKGLDVDGNPKSNFEPGMDMMAKVTVFGEGARGSLIKELAENLPLFQGKMPQVFETGIKEVLALPEDHPFFGQKTNVMHFMGYPLGLDVPGGGFIYEMQQHRIAIGYLTALCYDNPFLDIYETFLKFKKHPFIFDMISKGKVLEQGARTVCTSGFFSMPRLCVDGAMFIGAAAAMHDTPGLKGIHLAMKSGMLAAEACIAALEKGKTDQETLRLYPLLFSGSWASKTMKAGRNFAQGLAKPGLLKFMHLGAQHVSEGRGIRDYMPIEADASRMKPARKASKPAGINPECIDNAMMVDKLTGVYLSRTLHREDQPSHLVIRDMNRCIQECYPLYQSPCTRFCPAGVYEIVSDENKGVALKLNPSNCLHCKTCDVKDPFGNIVWTCPEGGEGPGYQVV